MELDFLRQVREKVPRLFFVLNKVDYLNGDERDQALSFFREILAEHLKLEKVAGALETLKVSLES